jgi:hypothetical protein
MPTPQFPRTQRGDVRIPAALLQGHSEAVEALADPLIPDGTTGGNQIIVSPWWQPWLVAAVTAKDASNPPAYSWARVIDLDGAGIPGADSMASVGVPGRLPAFELNGNPDVPIGAVVQLWPSWGGSCYYFSYPPFAGTLSGDITFTGDVVWTSTSTVTVNQGAKYVFQSTSSAGTPPGELSLPTLTVAGPPTWTPPAGTYPIEYSTVDGVYWQWNGSTWVDMSTAGGLTSPLINKGDIWIHNGTTDTRLPVGTDDYVLTANSAQATGLEWIDPPWLVDPLTTLGDLLFEDTTPEPARLAGNTTTTKKWLSQTGTGTISAAPAWDVIAIGDLPGTQTLSLGGTPTLSAQPTWIKVTVSYTDLQIAATSKTIVLAALPAGACLHAVRWRVTTGFTGVVVSAMSIGFSGGAVTASNNSFYASVTSPSSAATLPTHSTSNQPDTENLSTAWNVTLTASSGSNLSGLTAGALTAWLLVSQPG